MARLDLLPIDRATAVLATALSSRYRLRAADATHLAAAVSLGADRFITNNQRDFPTTIAEIGIIQAESCSSRRVRNRRSGVEVASSSTRR